MLAWHVKDKFPYNEVSDVQTNGFFGRLHGQDGTDAGGANICPKTRFYASASPASPACSAGRSFTDAFSTISDAGGSEVGSETGYR